MVALLGIALAFTLLTPTWQDRNTLWYVNHAREQAGLPVLHGSVVLDSEAHQRAIDIETTFGHTTPRGDHAWDELPATFKWARVGEILAEWSSPDKSLVISAWLHSAEHRVVLLGNWKWAGASVINHNGRYYYCVLFSS